MNKAMDRYLYAVQTLHEKYCCVRAVDVAHHLGLSKPAVSVAVRQMEGLGWIDIQPDGNLSFTEEGKAQAEKLDDRIRFFRRFLTDAGVEPSLALQDAMSFAWRMSDASFEAFRAMGRPQA